MSQTIAYLDCHSGISGNMFLGALLDAGLSLEALQQTLGSLPLTGYQLTLDAFHDKGIRGQRFEVLLASQEQPERHLSDIAALLHAASLPPRVRETALAIFRRLAEAEAKVHGSTVEEVHFHEVGAIDAIIDIVGAALGIEMLGITQLYASPLPLTTGHVQTSHGLLPVPAPATLEILSRVRAPWKSCTVEGELVTPTGAAILATVAGFETPALAIERVGYGFGHKSLPWPNCLRLCLGQSTPRAETVDTDWVTVIETHIDNMSGELLGGLMERLLVAGAFDVSYTPIQMKKNRPATHVTVICPPEIEETLAEVLLRETSTLGVRMQRVQRRKARRIQREIMTPLGAIMMKIKYMGRRIISAAPEYDACERVAQAHKLPLEEVYEVVQNAIQRTIMSGGEENV